MKYFFAFYLMVYFINLSVLQANFIKLFKTMSAFNDYSALSIYGPPIEQGKQGEFYVLNGIKYYVRFPMDWALDHNPTEQTAKCGPEFCEDCQTQGFYRSVFVGYCGNCSACYEKPRGRAGFPPRDGFWVYYQICDQEDLEKYHLSYMKGVPLSEIGDEEEEVEQELPQDYPTQTDIDEFYGDQEKSDYYDGDYDYEYEYEPNNDDYYDQWDEDRQLDYELSRVPRDMRAALDPRYQSALADFRAEMEEQSR